MPTRDYNLIKERTVEGRVDAPTADAAGRSPAEPGAPARPERNKWMSFAFRYGLAVASVAVTVVILILLQRYSISINLTILVVAALLIPTWWGGRGPGIVVAISFVFVTIAGKPPVLDASLGTYIFGQLSFLSLYLVLVLIVSARHNAEKKLKKQSEWLNVTLSSINDGVIATDTAGLVTFINPIAEGLTGWTAKEAAGRPVSERR